MEYIGDEMPRLFNNSESVVVLNCHRKGIFEEPSHQQKGARCDFGGDAKDIRLPIGRWGGAHTIDPSIDLPLNGLYGGGIYSISPCNKNRGWHIFCVSQKHTEPLFVHGLVPKKYAFGGNVE
jgi:hypothetical protein